MCPWRTPADTLNSLSRWFSPWTGQAATTCRCLPCLPPATASTARRGAGTTTATTAAPRQQHPPPTTVGLCRLRGMSLRGAPAGIKRRPYLKKEAWNRRNGIKFPEKKERVVHTSRKRTFLFSASDSRLDEEGQMTCSLMCTRSNSILDKTLKMETNSRQDFSHSKNFDYWIFIRKMKGIGKIS